MGALAMKVIKPTTYQTVEEVDATVRLREAEADLLPPGTARQSILIEVAQLRAYADIKRWIDQPRKQRSVI
jgi:hypothetical protein